MNSQLGRIKRAHAPFVIAAAAVAISLFGVLPTATPAGAASQKTQAPKVHTKLGTESGGLLNVVETGSHFSNGGNIRVDVTSPSSGSTYYGWTTASSKGKFTVSVVVPDNEFTSSCRKAACKFTGTLSVDVLQYSLPQIQTTPTNVGVHFKPAPKPFFAAVQTGDNSVNPLQVTAFGDQWTTGQQLEIVIEGDGDNGLFSDTGFATVQPNGAFTSNVAVDRNDLSFGCDTDCRYGGSVTVDVFYASYPHDFVADSRTVTLQSNIIPG
jgi:hypothetical protein